MDMTDFTESHKMGEESENVFENMSKNRGYVVTKATAHENIFKHIDYHLFKGCRDVTVDVKARKSQSRGISALEYEECPEDEWIWVEFLNVKGNNGWLYGKSKIIAFEFPNRFILVERVKLAKLSEKIIDREDISYYPRLARYRGYRRRSRPLELTGMLTLADILTLKTWIWRK